MSNIRMQSLSDKELLRKMGEFVKQRRIANNKTQAEVAKAANLSRSSVSLLERGETVTTTTLLQVLRVIGALDVLNAFLETPGLSPLAMLKEEKAKRWRVRKTDGNDELLKPEW